MKSISMKTLPIVAVLVAGLAGACTYKHETVERPAAAPAGTVVATPAPAGTVVYTEPSSTSSSTTVYTTR
ncbi:hypothetical protein [Reyranella sp.]|uniref:hypothetical protein n=1 Tax=Reyranella sp. TaxID=1929291 RepID=UPI003BA88815